MKETDLFEPVRDYFAADGYTVAAEVKHCDVVAFRDDELIIVELKTALNMTLLTQAVKRQHLTDDVYVAIPEPKRRSRRFREQQVVIKRLGLGMLTVYRSPVRSTTNCLLTPVHSGRKNKRQRDALLEELKGRTIQPNLGGTRGGIYTAYRETAVTIACLLARRGPSRPADLAPLTGPGTRSILYTNHYGWFERVSRGIYQLTEEGHAALADYPDIVALARQLPHQ